MNAEAERSSNKKRLLVPIVVLMLCAVAVTGAAYAAVKTTVNNTASVGSDYYVIDLYDESKTVKTGNFTAADMITFYTDRNATMGVVTIKADVKGDATLGYVAVSKGSGLVDAAVVFESLTATGWTVNKVPGSEAWTIEKTISGSVVKITVTMSDVNAEHYRPITLGVTVTNGTANGSAVEVARALNVAVSGLTFSMSFSSEKA